ncbi:hypothetical protein K493DRAFT_315591 [Basidiobolus meristosporus CBS 931.73]|uniref:BZIP domain-containing protein n=1 Tax=Basidiobolus meristosporus CBS 931.73 TaxID=1314790 RepID=A0A1Y1Y889_9FUNG|nr:hypothetical protein K493DRAFT_315591 [Basidiobolus meristosporus CBS 931.73]|eukprot:ORX94237.1 hypothetical protein K493DRAFT_315591 [Basidiobolus meristosporus CBS 931.73]
MSMDDMPLKVNTQPQPISFLQGVPLPKLGGQAPLFYPHGLAGLPGFPGIPLFATSLPVLPAVQPTPEPPKKKRGRKKREPCPAPSTANLVPLKPLIPVGSQTSSPHGLSEANKEIPKPVNVEVTVKKETPETTLQNLPIDSPKPAVSPKLENRPAYASTNSSPNNEAAAAAALSKRQERLIKNRAAALLSRKRKREHMANLETTNETLVQENDDLKIKVQEMEDQMKAVAHERDQAQEECQRLRKMLEEATAHKRQEASSKGTSTETAIEIENMDIDLEGNFIAETETDDVIKPEDKKLSKPKTTGVVLMIMFFSFALFSLPLTNYQSTIGGSYGGRATMGANLFTPSPHVNAAAPRVASVESDRDTKIVKRSDIDNANPKCHMNETKLPRSASGEEATRAMHSWLSSGQTYDNKESEAETDVMETTDQMSMEVTSFKKQGQNVLPPFFDHAYLYCANMQHFFTKHNETNPKAPNQRPRISLLSPLGGVFPPPWLAGPEDRKYLKIDLEVTGSGLVDTGDSWMFPGLKRAFTHSGTINS